MGTIGIIAAMDEEIAFLRSKMEIKVTKSAVGNEFYIGSYMGRSIVAVKCGIGKVNAALCTQAMIDLFAVDYIINTGCAGAIYKDLKIGDIVVSVDAVQHDFDCSAFGDPIGVIPRMDESTFKADESLIEIAQASFDELELAEERNMVLGRIASGDVFVSSKERKKAIWETVKGYCAEMEGAAIAHACYLNKIPFVIIRAISDSADDSGEMDFNEFVTMAARVSSALTEKMIEKI